jgi:phosphate transport system substrate-binding protein
MYKEAKNPAESTTALKFFDWAYTNGTAMAAELDYVPLPASLIKQVQKTWATSISANGKPLWTAK